LPCLGVVSDPWKPAAQLDGCGQLAVLVEGGTDRGGVVLGNHKHQLEVAARAPMGKLRRHRKR